MTVLYKFQRIAGRGAAGKRVAIQYCKFFIETVSLMAPYWLWRAIGGSLMWLSHLVFAINFYRMIAVTKPVDVTELTIQKLKESTSVAHF